MYLLILICNLYDYVATFSIFGGFEAVLVDRLSQS